MSLSSQQAQPSRKTNCHPKIDFLWLSDHCLHCLYLFMTPTLIKTKYQTSLCPSKKASLWSFQKIRIGTSLTGKAAKISRVQPCLICWPFSSCAKVMLGNTANTCHHGPQHSLEFTDACVVSVIQTIFYHVECKPPSCQNGKLKVLKPHVIKRCLRPSCNACLTASTGMVTSYKTCIWF